MIGMLGRYGDSVTPASGSPLFLQMEAYQAARSFPTFADYQAHSPNVNPAITGEIFTQAQIWLKQIQARNLANSDRLRRSNAFPPRPGWMQAPQASPQTVAAPIVVEKETDWRMIALIGVAGAVAGKILLGKG